jgi:hypothetical protein
MLLRWHQLLLQLIKNNFADEFARFGTTAFGALPPVGVPSGYGYPAVTDSGYSLMPIDVSAMVSLLPTGPAMLANGAAATSHTYLLDKVATGVTTYTRRGIVVPPNTTVSVVVK